MKPLGHKHTQRVSLNHAKPPSTQPVGKRGTIIILSTCTSTRALRSTSLSTLPSPNQPPSHQQHYAWASSDHDASTCPLPLCLTCSSHPPAAAVTVRRQRKRGACPAEPEPAAAGEDDLAAALEQGASPSSDHDLHRLLLMVLRLAQQTRLAPARSSSAGLLRCHKACRTTQ